MNVDAVGWSGAGYQAAVSGPRSQSHENVNNQTSKNINNYYLVDVLYSTIQNKN